MWGECGEGVMCSSQHPIIPTRLAQLRPHKATHRGIFLNAKDAFPVTRSHTEWWERGEREGFSSRGNSGWIEWGCVACVTLACSQSRGTGSGRDPGRTQALLCVSLLNHYQTLHSNGQQAQAPLSERENAEINKAHHDGRWLRVREQVALAFPC